MLALNTSVSWNPFMKHLTLATLTEFGPILISNKLNLITVSTIITLSVITLWLLLRSTFILQILEIELNNVVVVERWSLFVESQLSAFTTTFVK
jgi:hypothetical protein